MPVARPRPAHARVSPTPMSHPHLGLAHTQDSPTPGYRPHLCVAHARDSPTPAEGEWACLPHRSFSRKNLGRLTRKAGVATAGTQRRLHVGQTSSVGPSENPRSPASGTLPLRPAVDSEPGFLVVRTQGPPEGPAQTRRGRCPDPAAAHRRLQERRAACSRLWPHRGSRVGPFPSRDPPLRPSDPRAALLSWDVFLRLGSASEMCVQ